MDPGRRTTAFFSNAASNPGGQAAPGEVVWMSLQMLYQWWNQDHANAELMFESKLAEAKLALDNETVLVPVITNPAPSQAVSVSVVP
jgi:hypothetical protein